MQAVHIRWSELGGVRSEFPVFLLVHGVFAVDFQFVLVRHNCEYQEVHSDFVVAEVLLDDEGSRFLSRGDIRRVPGELPVVDAVAGLQ